MKEESLTDWFLDDLTRHVPNVRYIAFNRHQEAGRTGADWEWWILFPSGAFRFRVQAKKLSDRADNYRNLAYSNRKGVQIDMLLEDAAKAQAMPLYAFYTAQSGFGKCNYQTQASGVFIASAHRINSMLFSTLRHHLPASSLLNESVPFACFACCPLALTDFPDFLKGYFRLEGLDPAVPTQATGFHEVVPAYVLTFLQTGTAEVSAEKAALFENEDPPFDGLLVFDFRGSDFEAMPQS